MKIALCSYCNIQFKYKENSSGGVYCSRACYNEHQRNGRNKEYSERLRSARTFRSLLPQYFTAAERTGRLRRVRHGAITWYKLSHPCVDCGYNDPCALDFDHVRGEKLFNLQAAKTKPLEDIWAEIQKCEVRCANCHRIRTSESS